MNSSVSSMTPMTKAPLRRASTMSVAWDEKVLWPGLQSLYLGLSQNRDDIEWYIGWYYLYRIGVVIPMVYLTD